MGWCSSLKTDPETFPLGFSRRIIKEANKKIRERNKTPNRVLFFTKEKYHSEMKSQGKTVYQTRTSPPQADGEGEAPVQLCWMEGATRAPVIE